MEDSTFIWEVHSRFGVREEQCYNPLPATSRAEPGAAAGPGDGPGLERAAGQRATPPKLGPTRDSPESGCPLPQPSHRRVLWLPLEGSGCPLSPRPGTRGISLHMSPGTSAPLPSLQLGPAAETTVPFCTPQLPSTCLPLPILPWQQDHSTPVGLAGSGTAVAYRCAGAPAPSRHAQG